MAHNKASMIAGINNLLKRNYGISPEIVDVVALVDSTLSFTENWAEIKDYVAPLIPNKIVGDTDEEIYRY